MRLRGQTILGSALGGLALFLLLATSLAAQAVGRGGLSGLITDSSGAAIPGASVVLTNTATGVGQHGQSSGAGLYAFVGLVPGDYTMEVTHAGFKASRQQHITIVVDQNAKLNLELQVGAENQQVTVSAAPVLAETSSATTGQLIGATVIDRMPLVNRNVYQLATLSPGMIPARGAASSVGGSTTAVSNFSVNGTMPASLQYVVDGAPITAPANGPGGVNPTMGAALDSVQEFRVELSTVPANFQSYGAGVISVVTKSGTNALHGDAFGFIRPDALNANNTFTKAAQLSSGKPNKPTPFSRKQFGGALGGPILKNKMFFFGDYEATRQTNAINTTLTVPTADEKKGLFAYPIYNPFNIANGPNCPAPAAACPQPFAGNQIPTINPVAQAYLAGWPAPNQPGDGPYHNNNFFGSGTSPYNADRFDARLDDALTSNQHLFGRFSWSHELQAAGPNYSGSILYPVGGTLTHGSNVMVGYDWSVTPNAILQIRSSMARQMTQGGPSAQYGFDMTQLGFPSSLAKTSLFSTVPGIQFVSSNTGNGSASGSVGLGTTSYGISNLANTNYGVSTTMNLIRGRHQISFGWDYLKYFYNEGSPISPSGFYTFDPAATSSKASALDGSSFASFLLGVGSIGQSFNFTQDVFTAKANSYNGFFFQDDIHLTPTLTLNAGVRWDLFGGETERYNRLSYFDPALAYTVNGVSLTGGDRFVGPGNRSPAVMNRGDIGPRLGLTWQPLSKMVVRGGFGYFYGPSTHGASSSIYSADGFTSTTTWQAATLNSDGYIVPGNPLNNPFPNGILMPSGNTLGPATNLGGQISTLQHEGADPLTYNFNFGAEYQLPAQTVVSVGWVGSRGLRLPITHDNLNQLPFSTIEQYGAGLNTLVPYPYAPAITNPSAVWYGHTQVPQWVMLTPHPQFVASTAPAPLGGVQLLSAGLGDSVYHSLQAKLEKHMSHHFTLLSAFTWSKNITNDGQGPIFYYSASNTKPQNVTDMHLERSLSNQDVPFVFSFAGSWDLPVGQGRALGLSGWANEALGGWTLTSMVTVTSGVPISTPSGTGSPWFNQRPDQVASCAIGAARTPQHWLNYSCLAQPASPYLPGTAAATLPGIRADGTHNLDLSITKHFSVGEQRDLLFRFAAYNFTNSVQWGYPSVFWRPTQTASNMAGFGRVTSTANSPRQVSGEVRFTF